MRKNNATYDALTSTTAIVFYVTMTVFIPLSIFLVHRHLKSVDEKEDKYTYDKDGCQLDADGNRVESPVRTRMGILYTRCTERTRSFGLYFAAVTAPPLLFFILYWFYYIMVNVIGVFKTMKKTKKNK